MMEQSISTAIMIFVGIPVLLLIFIGLVTLIIQVINEEIGGHPPAHKSVATLINEVSGYRSPQLDPLEARMRQIVEQSQQQVEDEVMANFDNIVTIIKKETNHQ